MKRRKKVVVKRAAAAALFWGSGGLRRPCLAAEFAFQLIKGLAIFEILCHNKHTSKYS